MMRLAMELLHILGQQLQMAQAAEPKQLERRNVDGSQLGVLDARGAELCLNVRKLGYKAF